MDMRLNRLGSECLGQKVVGVSGEGDPPGAEGFLNPFMGYEVGLRRWVESRVSVLHGCG